MSSSRGIPYQHSPLPSAAAAAAGATILSDDSFCSPTTTNRRGQEEQETMINSNKLFIPNNNSSSGGGKNGIDHINNKKNNNMNIYKYEYCKNNNGDVVNDEDDEDEDDDDDDEDNMNQFDPNADKYQCCCKSFHATRGALAVGIIELICLVFSVLGVAGSIPSNLHNSLTMMILVSILVWLGFFFCGILSLLYAVRVESRKWMIPHLVIQAISLVVLGCLLTFSIAIVATQGAILDFPISSRNLSRADERELKVSLGISLFISLSVGIGLEIWFFTVIMQCYRFLNDKLTYVKLYEADEE